MLFRCFQEQAGRMQRRKESIKTARLRPASARIPLPAPKELAPKIIEPNSTKITASEPEATGIAPKTVQNPSGVLVERKANKSLMEAVVRLDKIRHSDLAQSSHIQGKSAIKVKMKIAQKPGVDPQQEASKVTDAATVPTASTGTISTIKQIKGPSDAKNVQMEEEGDKKRAKKRRVIIAPVKCRRAEEHLKEPFLLQNSKTFWQAVFFLCLLFFRIRNFFFLLDPGSYWYI
jgi:hypothetical protein